MKSHIVPLVLLLSMFGCAHAYHWAKAEATQQEWTKDSDACERYDKERAYFERGFMGNLTVQDFLIDAFGHEVLIRNSIDRVLHLRQSTSIFGGKTVEYFPTRAGELLSVIAIEQHMITLIGNGGNQYHARYFAAQERPKVAPLRPADILVVIHPNPVGKSALVEHATKGWRDGDQYHLIFDVA